MSPVAFGKCRDGFEGCGVSKSCLGPLIGGHSRSTDLQELVVAGLALSQARPRFVRLSPMPADQITHLLLEVSHQPFIGFHPDPKKQPITSPFCPPSQVIYASSDRFGFHPFHLCSFSALDAAKRVLVRRPAQNGH